MKKNGNKIPKGHGGEVPLLERVSGNCQVKGNVDLMPHLGKRCKLFFCQVFPTIFVQVQIPFGYDLK